MNRFRSEDAPVSVVTMSGKRYALRNDGYRVWARQEGSDGRESCVFEYKHSDCDDANEIVDELLVRAIFGQGRDQIFLERAAENISREALARTDFDPKGGAAKLPEL